LAFEKIDFSVEVVSFHLEILILINYLGVLILVACHVPLLVLYISSQSRAFPVPEVDFISVLSSTLVQETKLAFDFLPIELPLLQCLFKFGNTVDKCLLVSVVRCADLCHAFLFTLEFILFIRHHCDSLLKLLGKSLFLVSQLNVSLAEVKFTNLIFIQ